MVNCTACYNCSPVKNITYFAYPKDVEKRNAWFKAVGREDLIARFQYTKWPNVKICEEHFRSHFFRYSTTTSAKFLKRGAFPTLNLRSKEGGPSAPPSSTISRENNADTENLTEDVLPDPVTNLIVNPSNIIVSNEHIANEIDTISIKQDQAIVKCDYDNESSYLGPTNVPEKREPIFMEDTTYTEQTHISELTDNKDFMPKGMLQLIQWQQESNENKNDTENRESFLCFAFHLHYMGSTTYTFLRNTFRLPPLKTLKKLVEPKGTKIDDTLFSVLKIKVGKMGLQERICSVCVSCVAIKKNLFYDITNDRIVGFNDINGRQKYEPAEYAVVIIVRGIVLSWKQIISYAFLSQFKDDMAVNAWIQQIIFHLLKIGLDVRALVADHSDSLDLSKDVNIDNTYFSVHGQKIYYVFDVPRLMNSLKNNLMKCHYFFENKIGKWDHIKDMYHHDKNSLVRLAPKLTDNHFQPSKSVKLTAQVLSTNVAFAIKTLIQSNLIDSSAKDTVELVLKLDKLFDILNSCKLRGSNKFKAAFCGDDFQIDFLQEMLGFFRRLKVIAVGSNTDVTNSMKFIKCFQITIKSFLNLFKDLQLEGVKSIFTRSLNLEPNDIFFEKVNQTNEIALTPTCRQVMETFNRRFVIDILKEPFKKDCGNDYESLLATEDNGSSLIEGFLANYEDVAPIILDTNDYQFDLPQENGLITLSVYLFKKCLEKHTCSKLITYLKVFDQELAGSSLVFTLETSTTLPDNFLTFVKLLDSNFCDYFTIMSNSTIEKDANICNDVLFQIQYFTFGAPCECFPIDYLKKLFVRSRIHHTVKKYNEFLKSEEYGKIPFDFRFL